MDSPFGLLAELTYRCPLACAYCPNPLNMADYQDELTTDEWRRVLVEARDPGVLQCHLSGEACRSCDRRELDFGGCRCQAFQLTGDAACTDPVCHLSPDHDLVARAVEAANADSRADDLPLIARLHRVRRPARIPGGAG